MRSLYSFCSVLLYGICRRIMQATFPKLPPLQNNVSLPNYHHYKVMIYLFPCSCVLCRVLRWINTYYLCAVCRVRAWQCFSRVEVWHILLCLIVFIQSLMFRYVILDLVYYFNRTLYRQCFCVYGRFFAREYLYIT